MDILEKSFESDKEDFQVEKDGKKEIQLQKQKTTTATTPTPTPTTTPPTTSNMTTPRTKPPSTSSNSSTGSSASQGENDNEKKLVSPTSSKILRKNRPQQQQQPEHEKILQKKDGDAKKRQNFIPPHKTIQISIQNPPTTTDEEEEEGGNVITKNFANQLQITPISQRQQQQQQQQPFQSNLHPTTTPTMTIQSEFFNRLYGLGINLDLLYNPTDRRFSEGNKTHKCHVIFIMKLLYFLTQTLSEPPVSNQNTNNGNGNSNRQQQRSPSTQNTETRNERGLSTIKVNPEIYFEIIKNKQKNKLPFYLFYIVNKDRNEDVLIWLFTQMLKKLDEQNEGVKNDFLSGSVGKTLDKSKNGGSGNANDDGSHLSDLEKNYPRTISDFVSSINFFCTFYDEPEPFQIPTSLKSNGGNNNDDMSNIFDPDFKYKDLSERLVQCFQYQHIGDILHKHKYEETQLKCNVSNGEFKFNFEVFKENGINGPCFYRFPKMESDWKFYKNIFPHIDEEEIQFMLLLKEKQNKVYLTSSTENEILLRKLNTDFSMKNGENENDGVYTQTINDGFHIMRGESEDQYQMIMNEFSNLGTRDHMTLFQRNVLEKFYNQNFRRYSQYLMNEDRSREVNELLPDAIQKVLEYFYTRRVDRSREDGNGSLKIFNYDKGKVIYSIQEQYGFTTSGEKKKIHTIGCFYRELQYFAVQYDKILPESTDIYLAMVVGLPSQFDGDVGLKYNIYLQGTKNTGKTFNLSLYEQKLTIPGTVNAVSGKTEQSTYALRNRNYFCTTNDEAPKGFHDDKRNEGVISQIKEVLTKNKSSREILTIVNGKRTVSLMIIPMFGSHAIASNISLNEIEEALGSRYMGFDSKRAPMNVWDEKKDQNANEKIANPRRMIGYQELLKDIQTLIMFTFTARCSHAIPPFLVTDDKVSFYVIQTLYESIRKQNFILNTCSRVKEGCHSYTNNLNIICGWLELCGRKNKSPKYDSAFEMEWIQEASRYQFTNIQSAILSFCTNFQCFTNILHQYFIEGIFLSKLRIQSIFERFYLFAFQLKMNHPKSSLNSNMDLFVLHYHFGPISVDSKIHWRRRKVGNEKKMKKNNNIQNVNILSTINENSNFNINSNVDMADLMKDMTDELPADDITTSDLIDLNYITFQCSVDRFVQDILGSTMELYKNKPRNIQSFQRLCEERIYPQRDCGPLQFLDSSDYNRFNIYANNACNKKRHEVLCFILQRHQTRGNDIESYFEAIRLDCFVRKQKLMREKEHVLEKAIARGERGDFMSEEKKAYLLHVEQEEQLNKNKEVLMVAQKWIECDLKDKEYLAALYKHCRFIETTFTEKDPLFNYYAAFGPTNGKDEKAERDFFTCLYQYSLTRHFYDMTPPKGCTDDLFLRLVGDGQLYNHTLPLRYYEHMGMPAIEVETGGKTGKCTKIHVHISLFQNDPLGAIERAVGELGQFIVRPRHFLIAHKDQSKLVTVQPKNTNGTIELLNTKIKITHEDDLIDNHGTDTDVDVDTDINANTKMKEFKVDDIVEQNPIQSQNLYSSQISSQNERGQKQRGKKVHSIFDRIDIKQDFGTDNTYTNYFSYQVQNSEKILLNEDLDVFCAHMHLERHWVPYQRMFVYIDTIDENSTSDNGNANGPSQQQQQQSIRDLNLAMDMNIDDDDDDKDDEEGEKTRFGEISKKKFVSEYYKNPKPRSTTMRDVNGESYEEIDLPDQNEKYVDSTDEFIDDSGVIQEMGAMDIENSLSNISKTSNTSNTSNLQKRLLKTKDLNKQDEKKRTKRDKKKKKAEKKDLKRKERQEELNKEIDNEPNALDQQFQMEDDENDEMEEENNAFSLIDRGATESSKIDIELEEKQSNDGSNSESVHSKPSDEELKVEKNKKQKKTLLSMEITK